ncbi:hypothetical protein BD626DRAFT_546847 [Schizophyllum amplum]|uniref:Protein Zds1 C-terminal domain-containing protein n=1 Tax=Schizophyllum amplum TaxID=97359 RepID=A0A550CKJ6_9AGAR|nr:hypothetical protein BD626DRAFT_546847 [Auriculariopsis ampla]
MQQPSQYEIEREVEALRDLKRRSQTPATIDPDLPNAASPGGSGAAYWAGGSSAKGGESSGSSHEDGTTDDHSEESSSTSHSGSSEGPTNAEDDPLHLFWVPAGLHPEIAPQEFRAFLKEHSRSPPPTDASALPSRSPSLSSLSSGLGRKKSMLSRQYRPREGDDIENEEVVPLRRNRSSYYQSQGPQLTINDLQKLEELAEEASSSDDPSKLRSMLRRSLSLNMDEADAPIIVPPPGLILRRAARTKIRKAGLPGDGNGHRFGRRATRPDSISDTIYDAYAREDEEIPPVPPVPIITSPPPKSPPRSSSIPTQTFEALGPVLHQPQPQHLSPQPPEAPVVRGHLRRRDNASPPPSEPAGAVAGPSQPRKEKTRRVFGKWAPTRVPRRATTSQARALPATAREGEGEGSGRKRRKRRKNPASLALCSVAARRSRTIIRLPVVQRVRAEAAQALLGSSKSSKSYQPPPSPSQPSTPGMNNWSRYPIHVERAIYRLSHIKLANPRRPLYEQVLISNLMFWYLGVINKAQNPQVAGAGAGAARAEREMEQKKREAQQPRRGPLTKPPPAGQVGGRRAEMPSRPAQQYGAYNNGSIQPGMVMPRQHPPPHQRVQGQPPNQYGNGPMPQQYGNGQPQYANGPPPNQYGNGMPGQYGAPPPHHGAPKLVQPHPQQSQHPQQQLDNFYYQTDQFGHPSQQRGGGLPPGAMAPMQRPTGSPSPPPSAQNPHRSSRSPPPMVQQPQFGNGHKGPGRSLSATAVPSPPPQGPNVLSKPRKGQSAHAVPAGHRSRTTSGSGQPNGVQEEDLPLAMWQQQQRRR